MNPDICTCDGKLRLFETPGGKTYVAKDTARFSSQEF